MMRKLLWFTLYFSIGLAVVVDAHKRMNRELPEEGGVLFMTIMLWPTFPAIAAISYVFPHKQR